MPLPLRVPLVLLIALAPRARLVPLAHLPAPVLEERLEVSLQQSGLYLLLYLCLLRKEIFGLNQRFFYNLQHSLYSLQYTKANRQYDDYCNNLLISATLNAFSPGYYLVLLVLWLTKVLAHLSSPLCFHYPLYISTFHVYAFKYFHCCRLIFRRRF